MSHEPRCMYGVTQYGGGCGYPETAPIHGPRGCYCCTKVFPGVMGHHDFVPPSDADRDYEGMREFQAKFIAANQERIYVKNQLADALAETERLKLTNRALYDENAKLRADLNDWKAAEGALSEAYLRIRMMLGIPGVGDGATPEEIWRRTEDRLRQRLSSIVRLKDERQLIFDFLCMVRKREAEMKGRTPVSTFEQAALVEFETQFGATT